MHRNKRTAFLKLQFNYGFGSRIRNHLVNISSIRQIFTKEFKSMRAMDGKEQKRVRKKKKKKRET